MKQLSLRTSPLFSLTCLVLCLPEGPRRVVNQSTHSKALQTTGFGKPPTCTATLLRSTPYENGLMPVWRRQGPLGLTSTLCAKSPPRNGRRRRFCTSASPNWIWLSLAWFRIGLSVCAALRPSTWAAICPLLAGPNAHMGFASGWRRTTSRTRIRDSPWIGRPTTGTVPRSTTQNVSESGLPGCARPSGVSPTGRLEFNRGA